MPLFQACSSVDRVEQALTEVAKYLEGGQAAHRVVGFNELTDVPNYAPVPRAMENPLLVGEPVVGAKLSEDSVHLDATHYVIVERRSPAVRLSDRMDSSRRYIGIEVPNWMCCIQLTRHERSPPCMLRLSLWIWQKTCSNSRSPMPSIALCSAGGCRAARSHKLWAIPNHCVW